MHNWGTLTLYSAGDSSHALAVENLAVGDRRVCLDKDVFALAVGDQFARGVARVHQDLIDVRGHGAVLEDVVQILL